MNFRIRTKSRYAWLCSALLWPGTGWTYACSLETNGLTVVYAGSPVDVRQTLVVRCTKEAQESPELWYRVQADLGSNPTNAQPFRAVRRGGSTYRLAYALKQWSYRNCSDTTDWLAPGGSSTVNVIWDYLLWNRYGTIPITHPIPFCVRVLGSDSPSGPIPASGTYHDQFQVTLDLPRVPYARRPSPITVTVPVIVNVTSHCKLETRGPLHLDLTSFSRQEKVAATQAFVACSDGHHWDVRIDPPGGTLMGVAYTLALQAPRVGAPLDSGTSNGMPQQIDIVGRVAAGQAGTCATGTCTARQTHTLTIDY